MLIVCVILNDGDLMILYKYVSFYSAIEILKNNSIGFTCVEDFNDPFECTNFGFSDASDISPKIATNAYKSNLSRDYAVLSLTRNPLNSLMWSHYADSHTGVVIGIDADVAGLGSDDEFVIPYQMGELTYVATKHKDIGGIPSVAKLDEIKKEICFKSELQNVLKQAFLYKSLEWAYEEEIRVVKSLLKVNYSYHREDQSIDERWYKVRLDAQGQPLFCWKIPDKSIKEIYLGRQINRLACRRNNGENRDWVNENIAHIKKRKCKVYACDVDVSSWKLIPRLIST